MLSYPSAGVKVALKKVVPVGPGELDNSLE